MSNFKTKFCWWPVRLARHVPVLEHISGIDGKAYYEERMEFIGWVWMQKAHLTNNLNHGWVAFLDAKPWPKKCKTCGQELPANAKVSGGGAFPPSA